MNEWILIYLGAFTTVATLAGLIIPQILLIAFRKNLFDEVDPRKIHKGVVPRLGGIAFFPSILFALLLLLGICMKVDAAMVVTELKDYIIPFCFIVCGIVMLYLVGMADDLVGVRYLAKFIVQIISACLIAVGTIYFSDLHGFLWIHTVPMAVAVPLTLLLVVFITNAMNLIDGIDGLASGLSAFACLFYAFILFSAGLHLYGLIAVATLGALVPFFYYNVFGNINKHKKIFMGDTGALTVGLILSALSIRICQIDDNTVTYNAGVAAFAPLLIPCLDVVRVYFHRLRCHRNPFLPDKNHIHHKLLALGMSQRTAMPTIVGSSVVLTLINYFLSDIININILFAADLLIWIVSNMLLSRAILRSSNK